MPCWHDIWELLWPIPWWALITVCLASVILLLWAPGFRRPWQRYTSRVLGLLGASVLILYAPVLIIAIGLSSGDTKQGRIAMSPDGSEKAVLMFYGGALGLSTTDITLTAMKCPCKHTFMYQAYTDEDAFETTEMEWIDNTHLRIAYLDNGSPGVCKTNLGAIRILCTPLRAPEPVPQHTIPVPQSLP